MNFFFIFTQLRVVLLFGKFAVATIVLSFSGLVLAWGHQGHEVVAGYADSLLTHKAKQETLRLLSLEPNQTLSSVSTWADEHRTKANAPWHFINFPRETCTYDLDRDCHDGQCAISALNSQIAILSNKTADDQERLMALKFVVHIIADIHQPLHAGFSDDKGGNLHQIQFNGKATNLHSLWDTGLVENLGLNNTQLISRLSSISINTNPTKQSVADFAAESCQIVHANDFYPSNGIDQNFLDAKLPILLNRLSIAGRRLAALLNSTLGE